MSTNISKTIFFKNDKKKLHFFFKEYKEYAKLLYRI